MLPCAKHAFADPPTITLHGNKDVLVPFRLAEQLTAALKQAGVRAELVSGPLAGMQGRSLTRTDDRLCSRAPTTCSTLCAGRTHPCPDAVLMLAPLPQAWHPHVEQVQQVAAFLDSVLAA